MDVYKIVNLAMYLWRGLKDVCCVACIWPIVMRVLMLLIVLLVIVTLSIIMVYVHKDVHLKHSLNVIPSMAH